MVRPDSRLQVILSAGSVGSPHLMQVSGIGEEAMLRSKGVTPVVALPGVGANLHVHRLRHRFWLGTRYFTRISQPCTAPRA